MPALTTTIPLLLLIILVIAASYVYKKRQQSAQADLPPGPPGHWLLGNEIPRPHAYRTFAKWSAQYGPLISIRVGQKLCVIIGSQQTALDIMEKKNAHLADRPHSIAAGDVMSGGMRFLLMGQCDRFRKLRKALQSQLTSKLASDYEPIQTRAAQNVILDILEDPDQHQVHARRYAASVVISLSYGKTTPTSYSDPEVQQMTKCLARLGAAMRIGAYWIDSFPILRYVPGYLTQLKLFHQEELNLFRGLLESVRTKMEKNEAQPCFAKNLIERQEELDLSNDEIAYLAGSMFGAGSNSTASAISIVIMAAALHPEAQQKVQDQLDLLIGHNKMPTFSDTDALTEVSAFILETYRWRPVSAGGFPHRATKDIHYGPYRIPAGTTVIGNHWAIGKDPVAYRDPESFIPSRWLDDSGLLKENMKSFNFGFGRRVCPGQHVAKRSVFLNTALILWAFKISEDPSSPIDTLAFSDTANVHPLPFRVKFQPRIPNLRAIVEMNM